MKSFMNVLLISMALFLCGIAAAEKPQWSSQRPTVQSGLTTRVNVVTEFVIMQHLNVETVTCGSYVALYDYTDTGTVTGNSCTSTGSLLNSPGSSGSISMTFNGLTGTSSVTGCAEAGVTAARNTQDVVLTIQFTCL